MTRLLVVVAASCLGYLSLTAAETAVAPSADRSALAQARLIDAELAMSRLDIDEANRLLDAHEAALDTWKDLTPAEIMASGWFEERAAEVRFMAALLADDSTPEALSSLYAPRAERLFERVVGDGTTLLSPLSYPGLLLRGREAEAARVFDRVLALLDAEPVKRFRLQVTRYATLSGLDARDLEDELAELEGTLAALPLAKVEDLADYRLYLLQPVFRLARANDFAGALQCLQAVLETHPNLPPSDRLKRYEPRLQALIELSPGENQREAVEPDDLPIVSLKTERGVIELTLFAHDAPESVANFIELVEAGYYDGVGFHRIVPHFVAQGGDPKGTGDGSPGYTIKREAGRRHLRGSIGMARDAAPDTAGSQFYFCLNAMAVHHLDDNYAVFGRVSAGLDVMDQLRLGDKIIRAEVTRRGSTPAAFTKLPES